MEKHYFSCAETAKLVRAALKKAFPSVKFGIRSHVYAGGASINVTWTDGPTERMINAITNQFAGGRFDGSIDLAYHVSHWLMPDGSVTVASDPGTVGSHGSNRPERNWMPSPDAKLVSFGANYIFTRRNYSDKFIRQACNRLACNGMPEFADAKLRTGFDSAWIADERGELVDMTHVLREEVSKLMIA